MSYQNISTFKTAATSKLHGTTLAKVSNIYGKLFEAAGKLRLRVFPPSIIKSAAIANAIYDRVYNYAIPDDCDTQSIIAIRPIGPRGVYDRNVPTQSLEQFDIKKAENTFTVEEIAGVKTLRLSKELTPRTIITTCDSTSDGTITLGGDASNLTVNYLDFISGLGSLSFDVSGATGQATIEFALAGPIDLSTLLNLGALFAWVKFPTALTSAQLEWGTDGSNAWSKSVTAAIDRAFVANAWQLLQFLWNSATKTGSPDEGAITWVRLTLNYASGTAYTGVLVDNITAALGSAYEVVYYSNAIFTDSTGATWKQTPTAESDLVRLDDDGINLLLYEFLLTLQQELKGKNMANDYAFFQTELYGRFGYRGAQLTAGLYQVYQEKYPSQVPPRQETYYEFDPLDGESNSGEGFD